MTTVQPSSFASQLEAWYATVARPLPWRSTSDPYAIWVSEVMLQQTQVATVLGYYTRFLATFPTVQALAAAPLDAVLKQWEGLGYYTRCRNLHKAAQQVVAQHGGVFPTTFEAVAALPGVGQSTAGAILTFAFGQKHPILDGNVKRVLARVFDMDEPLNTTKATKALWAYSAQLLAPSLNPFAFNQAFMELGATLCLAKNPQCLLCPVQNHCQAFKAGTTGLRPVPKATKTVPHHAIGVAVLQNEAGLFYIQQRPAHGLLGGLWEFPGGKREGDEALTTTVQRELQEELGITVVVGEKLLEVKHAYSHFKVTLHVYRCRLENEAAVPQLHAAQASAWVPLEGLTAYAFPKANNRIIEWLHMEAQHQEQPELKSQGRLADRLLATASSAAG